MTLRTVTLRTGDEIRAIAALLALGLAAPAGADERLEPYTAALEARGRPPLEFVVDELDRHDLILFDDAVHPAVEPFEFYQRLVGSAEFRKKAKYIFFEAFNIDHQRHLDAYLESRPENPELLYPVFQNDYSGFGWPLETYLDLLREIHRVNRGLEASQRLRVVAVSNPVCWRCIESPEDVRLMRRSHAGRDYLMYKVILSELDEFGSGRKGIFLTNTRHAYKGIKDRDGRYIWNTGTFFHQWHPGKTCSVRFHNVSLHIEKLREPDPETKQTTAGMERIDYRWVRVGDGIWDSAFKAHGNRPVAIPLVGTPFGREPYIGNHMLDAAPGQTLADAYDAVIFLAPLEELRLSATFDFIYTPEFKKELERRYGILNTEEQIRAELEARNVETLQELIALEIAAQPERAVLESMPVGPADAWRKSAP